MDGGGVNSLQGLEMFFPEGGKERGVGGGGQFSHVLPEWTHDGKGSATTL